MKRLTTKHALQTGFQMKLADAERRLGGINADMAYWYTNNRRDIADNLTYAKREHQLLISGLKYSLRQLRKQKT